MQSLTDQIRTKEFTRSRKGFDPDEVTEYLDKLADEVSELEADLRREGVRANALERKIQAPHKAEGNVEAAFLAAAESKQHLLDEAQDRAQQMITDARAEAARLVEVPKMEAQRAQEESTAILFQAKERLESATREASSIEERAKAETTQLEAESAERGRRAVEEADRRAQETIDAARHEAAIRIAAAQRESSDIRSTLEAEHTELVEKVRSLQVAVVGMIEHGAARSPALAAVFDTSEPDPAVEEAS
ncbi:MAG: DivIVA domain-containing protein [Acidimicrobiia bacterium]